MLSKKFFIEHANEQVKKLIRYQVSTVSNTHHVARKSSDTGNGSRGIVTFTVVRMI